VVAVTRWLRADRARGSEGFTLAEFLIFLVLMGVVLGIAYMLMSTLTAGRKSSDRDAEFSRAISTPMSRMSEIILQNTRIEANPAPGPYQLSVRTDQNVDDVQEQHNYTIVDDGQDTYIQVVSYTMTAAGGRVTPARFTHQLGSGITNLDSPELPLFRYYDADGNEITDMLRVPGEARSVVITIRATSGEWTMEQSQRVLFRNRQQ
jgi:hypothetical protein